MLLRTLRLTLALVSSPLALYNTFLLQADYDKCLLNGTAVFVEFLYRQLKQHPLTQMLLEWLKILQATLHLKISLYKVAKITD